MATDRLELAVVPADALSPAMRSAIVAVCGDALGTDCSTLFEDLSGSEHVLASIGGRLVGHACWTTRSLAAADRAPLRTAWVDAVVVAPSMQRRGIGTAVMRRLATETEDFELRGLGTEEMAFYERLGWERWHGQTLGVHHDPVDALMILRTALTPSLDPTEIIRSVG